MIYRNLYQHSNSAFLLGLYKPIVQPCLECCNIVWDPHQLHRKYQLLSVEKCTLRVCLKSWNILYDELISMDEMTPFAVHCARSKLIFVFKILYKSYFMPDSIFVPCSFCTSDHLNHALSLIPYVGIYYK